MKSNTTIHYYEDTNVSTGLTKSISGESAGWSGSYTHCGYHSDSAAVQVLTIILSQFVVIFCKVTFLQGSRQSLGQMSGLSDCPEKYRDIALWETQRKSTLRNTETLLFDKYKGRELKFPEKDRSASWQTLKRQASCEFETYTTCWSIHNKWKSTDSFLLAAHSNWWKSESTDRNSICEMFNDHKLCQGCFTSQFSLKCWLPTWTTSQQTKKTSLCDVATDADIFYISVNVFNVKVLGCCGGSFMTIILPWNDFDYLQLWVFAQQGCDILYYYQS